MKYDIILRNGIIIDGTGAPRFAGGVAIDADRIAAIGAVVWQNGCPTEARPGTVLRPGAFSP